MNTTNQNNNNRVTLLINHSLVTNAKAQVMVENTTLTNLVEKALIAYLSSEAINKKVSSKEKSNETHFISSTI